MRLNVKEVISNLIINFRNIIRKIPKRIKAILIAILIVILIIILIVGLVKESKKQKYVEYNGKNLSESKYPGIKELIDDDKNEIVQELKKINTELAQKIVIKKEDIIVNFKENWLLLNKVEKRQFLYKFINKIVIVNEKKGKQYFAKVLDVEFNDII